MKVSSCLSLFMVVLSLAYVTAVPELSLNRVEDMKIENKKTGLQQLPNRYWMEMLKAFAEDHAKREAKLVKINGTSSMRKIILSPDKDSQNDVAKLVEEKTNDIKGGAMKQDNGEIDSRETIIKFGEAPEKIVNNLPAQYIQANTRSTDEKVRNPGSGLIVEQEEFEADDNKEGDEEDDNANDKEADDIKKLLESTNKRNSNLMDRNKKFDMGVIDSRLKNELMSSRFQIKNKPIYDFVNTPDDLYFKNLDKGVGVKVVNHGKIWGRGGNPNVERDINFRHPNTLWGLKRFNDGIEATKFSNLNPESHFYNEMTPSNKDYGHGMTVLENRNIPHGQRERFLPDPTVLMIRQFLPTNRDQIRVKFVEVPRRSSSPYPAADYGLRTPQPFNPPPQIRYASIVRNRLGQKALPRNPTKHPSFHWQEFGFRPDRSYGPTKIQNYPGSSLKEFISATKDFLGRLREIEERYGKQNSLANLFSSEPAMSPHLSYSQPLKLDGYSSGPVVNSYLGMGSPYNPSPAIEYSSPEHLSPDFSPNLNLPYKVFNRDSEGVGTYFDRSANVVDGASRPRINTHSFANRPTHELSRMDRSQNQLSFQNYQDGIHEHQINHPKINYYK